MASIIAPLGSFVQFSGIEYEHCIYGTVRATLPVYEDFDVMFMFIIEGSIEEIDELAGGASVSVGIVSISGDLSEPVLMEFAEQPDRFRIADTQMQYYWPYGLPSFKDVVAVGDCFRIRISANLGGEDSVAVSNQFERIGDSCYTSVIEYGSEDNGFGFNYCASGPLTVPGGGGGTLPPTDSNVCTPTKILFSNESTIRIPYTAQLVDAYGSLPTVQVWRSNELGELEKMEPPDVDIKLDAYPPTMISLTFSTTISGVIIIK